MMSVFNLARKPFHIVAIVLTIVCSAFFLLETHDVAAKSNDSWKIVCADKTKVETCLMVQQLMLNQKNKEGQEHQAGQLLKLTVVYAEDTKTKIRQPYLSLQLPLGVDLRPGAVLRIDEEKEIPVQYLQCTNSGCDASLLLSTKIVRSLKSGKELFVGMRPWGSAKTAIIKASLSGFTKAFDKLK